MDEMRDARIRQLSPEARELLEEIQRRTADETQRQATGAQPRPLEEVVGDLNPRLGVLSSKDRATLATVMDAEAFSSSRAAEQQRTEAAMFERAENLIERALELDPAEGKPEREDMTLEVAVERLRRAGQITAEEERFYEDVKDQESQISASRRVPEFYPDFTDSDTWIRWDGSMEAKAWAGLLETRNTTFARAIVSSAIALSAVGQVTGKPVDLEGLSAALWNISDEEVTDIIAAHRKKIAREAEKLRTEDV
jgi:hypothetical protein